MSNKVYGADIYNMALTGCKGMALRAGGCPEKTPCAVYSVDMGGARV